MSGKQPIRHSPRRPQLAHEDSVHQYEVPTKLTKAEKDVAEKKKERSARPNRGLKRANTFFEYEGHPETRETKDNPFGGIVGKRIEIWFAKKKAWVAGLVAEHDAFNGLHIMEWADGTRSIHNLSKAKYRMEGKKKAEKPPTKMDVDEDDGKKDAKAPSKKKSKKADDGEEEDEEEEEEEEEEDDHHVADAVVAHGGAAGGAAAGAAGAATDGFIHSTEGTVAEVVATSGLADKGHVYVEGADVYEANLALVDVSKNMDKYYVVQVIESADKSQYWAVQHWGRTGTKGQTEVKGPYADKADAIAIVKDKFKEKAGIEFADRETAAAVKEHYQYKKKLYSGTAADATKKVMWQYFVDDFVDGKSTGWYNYVNLAAETVENVYGEWKFNEWLTVRCVESGHFEYKVDFNTMTQTNLKTGKCRKIRRVYV